VLKGTEVLYAKILTSVSCQKLYFLPCQKRKQLSCNLQNNVCWLGVSIQQLQVHRFLSKTLSTPTSRFKFGSGVKKNWAIYFFSIYFQLTSQFETIYQLVIFRTSTEIWQNNCKLCIRKFVRYSSCGMLYMWDSTCGMFSMWKSSCGMFSMWKADGMFCMRDSSCGRMCNAGRNCMFYM
jgi:hypothetical protein